MTTEDLIRQAFERQASRAPDAERVRTAFHARSRRSVRRRRGVMALAAAAAIAVPVIVPATLPGGQEEGDVVSPLPEEITMLYRPAWLPKGFREVRRVASTAHLEQLREWNDTGWTPERQAKGSPFVPTVQLTTSSRWRDSGRGSRMDTFPEGSANTEVNGVRAFRGVEEHGCAVAWMNSREQVFRVRVLRQPDSCGTAMRVARSILPDGRSVLSVPVRAAWLPRLFSGKDSDGGVSQTLTKTGCQGAYWSAGGDRPTAVTVKIGRGALPGGGAPVETGGRPARYVVGYPPPVDAFDDGYRSVVVDLGSGLILSVITDRKGLSKATLTRVAANVVVGAPPRCDWGP